MSGEVIFTPVKDLFEDDVSVPEGLLKQTVVRDFKEKNLIGVPDNQLQINFSPEEGGDILIRRVDPENALGYSVHASEEDYFNHLKAELYEPTEEDILGGLVE